MVKKRRIFHQRKITGHPLRDQIDEMHPLIVNRTGNELTPKSWTQPWRFHEDVRP